MASDEQGYACRYNENIQCQEMKCNVCGWNPANSESRMRKFLKKNGVKRIEPPARLIDASKAMERVSASIMPMLEAGKNPWQIYVEVMKCLNASETVDAEKIRCKDCRYTKQPKERKEGILVCRNEDSPCNRRKVKSEGYCPYGERRTEGEETDRSGSNYQKTGR